MLRIDADPDSFDADQFFHLDADPDPLLIKVMPV